MHRSIEEKKREQAAEEQAELALQNQAVFIRDLYVYPVDPSKRHGEAATVTGGHEGDLERLIGHIRLLAEEARNLHQAHYCQLGSAGDVSLKPDCLNHITRLLTHEFSMYTPLPLSIEDFQKLYDAIYDFAKERGLPNLHLLLSSIAVEVVPGQILNVSLYVECGMWRGTRPSSIQ